MKNPGMILQQRGRGVAVELSSADFSEILTALHCRRNPKSRKVIDKLTRALGQETRSPGCKEPR